MNEMIYKIIIAVIGMIIAVAIGALIKLFYEKRKDKREYEPRLFLNNMTFNIHNINVVYDGFLPIRFIGNEKKNTEKNYYFALSEIENLGKGEAQNIKLEWSIEDIDSLISEINFLLEKDSKEDRKILKVKNPEFEHLWINCSGFSLSGFWYPRIQQLDNILPSKDNKLTDIEFDNSYMYLLCLLISLRLYHIPNKEDENYYLTADYQEESFNQLKNLPASKLKISYQNMYDKQRDIEFKLTPQCGFYNPKRDPLAQEYDVDEKLKQFSAKLDKTHDAIDANEDIRIDQAIFYNSNSSNRLGISLKFDIEKIK